MRGDGSEGPDRAELIDRFGRRVDYLRLSVTDRCNFRCLYCMGEGTTFVPRAEVLSLDEMDRLASAFIGRGIRRLRLTGGEPLVRRDVLTLIESLSRHLAAGRLDEITLTTNGSQLVRHAGGLAAAGIRRLNVSLDTLDAPTFAGLTRHGDLARVLAGIDAALAAGLQVKINAVAMKGVNENQLEALMLFAHGRGMDLALIETMPMGGVDGELSELYLPLPELRNRFARRFTLEPLAERTGGPARYVRVAETGGRLGFIAPLSEGFCAACNRLRITCTGQLTLCLGHDLAVDLRGPLRASADDEALHRAIDAALASKPKGHGFVIGPHLPPAVARPMSVTGG